MEQCQTMSTNRTISTLVTSNINLSQLAEQSQPDSLVERRQAESLVEPGHKYNISSLGTCAKV